MKGATKTFNEGHIYTYGVLVSSHIDRCIPCTMGSNYLLCVLVHIDGVVVSHTAEIQSEPPDAVRASILEALSESAGESPSALAIPAERPMQKIDVEIGDISGKM